MKAWRSGLPTVPPLGDFAIADGNEAHATQGNSFMCRSNSEKIVFMRGRNKEHVMNVGELSYPADLRAPGKMRDRIICHERIDGTLLTDPPDSLKPFVYYFFRS